MALDGTEELQFEFSWILNKCLFKKFRQAHIQACLNIVPSPTVFKSGLTFSVS